MLTSKPFTYQTPQSVPQTTSMTSLSIRLATEHTFGMNQIEVISR